MARRIPRKFITNHVYLLGLDAKKLLELGLHPKESVDVKVIEGELIRRIMNHLDQGHHPSKAAVGALCQLILRWGGVEELRPNPR